MSKICTYCEKHKDITQCPHCKKYFCSEHIAPIEPGSYHPGKNPALWLERGELRDENTHPCPDYVDYLEQQKKVRSVRWGEALDELTGRKPKYEDEKYVDELRKRIRIDEDRSRQKEEHIKKKDEEKQKKLLKEQEDREIALMLQSRKDERLKRKELEKEKHKQEIEEKERLGREIEEKQKKHLKEQEKDEPYLYRYIPPEEKKSQQPQKVSEKYGREYVGIREENTKSDFYEKIKKYLGVKQNKIKFWLNNRPHRTHNNWHAISMNVLWMVGLSIFFLIIYSNLNKLNKIVLWFLPLGGTLLIITLIVWIKYIIKLFKSGYYWFNGERNWVRYSIIIFLLLILWQAYQYRETIFNPVVDFYDKTDFSSILPIRISESIPEKSVFSSKSVNSLKKTVEEKVSDVINTEPISQKTMDVEKAILKYTNIERKSNGLSDLSWDSSLSEVARDHSLDMVKNDFFSHVNLKGEDPTARAIRHNYNVHKELVGGWYSDGIAENIGKMPTGSITGGGYVSSDADSIGKAHVDSWMQSSGHRANILSSNYYRLGVGIAYDGTYYVATQNFW